MMSAGNGRWVIRDRLLTVVIHEDCGIATMLLDYDTTDKYLRRSAATLEQSEEETVSVTLRATGPQIICVFRLSAMIDRAA